MDELEADSERALLALSAVIGHEHVPGHVLFAELDDVVVTVVAVVIGVPEAPVERADGGADAALAAATGDGLPHGTSSGTPRTKLLPESRSRDGEARERQEESSHAGREDITAADHSPGRWATHWASR